ncbi:arylesterase [Actimicrobium sp. CCI2.3]|uniref:arylesterase n=1 Tax=Actimicrobium sp. CCI2.3 TaxID=3048616 RepID=UPI002AB59D2D|nr:arylesterase [Actimicrobium sp. CCI2.3]MDY7574948.1 arylesterase [Actimicrobium sp. CCI2.3]MEB0021481.1 arylesterase [Actimicrobium sp. CCI2.3]
MKWARVAVLAAVAMCATSAYSASKAVLVLGDSLSAEYGLARGEGWVALLEQRLKDDGIDATLINASISGETTSGGITRLPALLSKNKPAVVVVELGANDGLRGLALSDTQKNLRAIINAAKKSNARVVLVGMQLPPNYGTDYTKRFAAIFPTLAKDTKSALVPFMLDGVVTQPLLFQADRIHPTAQAHPIILDNIWPQLKPLLSK